MTQNQVVPMTEDGLSQLPLLGRDLKTALSYVSFYSVDSPFVAQSIQKFHKTVTRYLDKYSSLVIWRQGSKLMLNGTEWPDMFEFTEILENKGIGGVEIKPRPSVGELTLWLKWATFPVAKPNEELSRNCPHLHILTESECVLPIAKKVEEKAPMASATLESHPAGETKMEPAPVKGDAAQETLLTFLAEAWQYAQLQRRQASTSSESAALAHSFEKLFDRLLDRVENNNPGFESIARWFKAGDGELLGKDTAEAMVPLMETAVTHGWTSVLFDPSTAGLVNDCLAHWGSEGKAELVEKTVNSLAEGLRGDRYERELALTHLMDARPWVHRTELVDKVLENLNHLLGSETSPSLYQSGLLLAWDLVEPALETTNESHILTLLATLHFHADEDHPSFPDRNRIARHWLFERSTPDLVRKLASCAFRAGQLRHFPLLGEMAAPLLLDDYVQAAAAKRKELFPVLTELKESVQSVLAEQLAGMGEEEQVRSLIPLLRVSGFDPSLGLLLAGWLSRGTRELKLELLDLIEEMKDPVSGLALRFALFDDSEEIAARAAGVAGKIGFKAVIPVLIKAAKIREWRFPNNEQYLKAVCQALGDLRDSAALEMLEDFARKKPLLRGKNYSLDVRLAAIEALTRLQKPEAWEFVEKLMEEKNPALQEGLEKLIQNQAQKTIP